MRGQVSRSKNLNNSIAWRGLGGYNLLAGPGVFRLHVPEQADHRFRSKPITDSGASRSPVPEQADH